MNTTIIYSSEGEIIKSLLIADSDIDVNCPEGMSCIQRVGQYSSMDYYVVEGELVERPIMPITINKTILEIDEELLITGIPVGAVFYHADGSDVIDDGDLAWSSDGTGRFRMKLIKFPFKEVQIDVKVI